jgi:hypothetical protein
MTNFLMDVVPVEYESKKNVLATSNLRNEMFQSNQDYYFSHYENVENFSKNLLSSSMGSSSKSSSVSSNDYLTSSFNDSSINLENKIGLKIIFKRKTNGTGYEVKNSDFHIDENNNHLETSNRSNEFGQSGLNEKKVF